METIDMELLEEQAEFFKVLGHPNRLRIVNLLKSKPWCVCELADKLELNKSAVSKHLSLLKKVGVIDMEREGTQVICTLKTPCILEMFRCSHDVVIKKNKCLT
jgi:ArsR family transcriptional regulator